MTEPDGHWVARDGAAHVVWNAPDQQRKNGLVASRVTLIRRPAPIEQMPVAAEATARGHVARIVLVGDEGVGSVRMFWRESAGACKSYELNVDQGVTIDQAIGLLPR